MMSPKSRPLTLPKRSAIAHGPIRTRFSSVQEQGPPNNYSAADVEVQISTQAEMRGQREKKQEMQKGGAPLRDAPPFSLQNRTPFRRPGWRRCLFLRRYYDPVAA